MPRIFWQTSGGPADRPHVDLFLKHGVALIGPGDAGEWQADRRDEDFDGRNVRRFASEVQVGDAVLLRTGKRTIHAVGLVASDYVYLNQFDDVHGWDLQHARRIRWGRLAQPEELDEAFAPRQFAQVTGDQAVNLVQRVLSSPPDHWETAPLPPLLEEEPDLENLPEALQAVIGEVQDLNYLLQDPAAFGGAPSEDEMRTHSVVPLLRALGWPPELIAVEWHSMDVVLFRQLPRTPENVHLIIEAKCLGTGFEKALAQAKGYAGKLPSPVDILLTDGIRFRLYSSQDGHDPVAYANLARLKAKAGDLFTRLRRWQTCATGTMSRPPAKK